MPLVMISVSSWPARPTNGSPCRSSSRARALADEHQVARRIADAEDQLRAPAGELAALAVADVGAQRLERRGRSHAGLDEQLRARCTAAPALPAHGGPSPSPACRLTAGRARRSPALRARAAALARQPRRAAVALPFELGAQTAQHFAQGAVRRVIQHRCGSHGRVRHSDGVAHCVASDAYHPSRAALQHALGAEPFAHAA